MTITASLAIPKGTFSTQLEGLKWSSTEQKDIQGRYLKFFRCGRAHDREQRQPRDRHQQRDARRGIAHNGSSTKAVTYDRITKIGGAYGFARWAGGGTMALTNSILKNSGVGFQTGATNGAFNNTFNAQRAHLPSADRPWPWPNEARIRTDMAAVSTRPHEVPVREARQAQPVLSFAFWPRSDTP